MMIYLELFFTFLSIGAFSFGGGYGMIAMMREQVLLHGWLTEGELLDIIAVAESTPGPIAVNMATFIGSSEAGILGALVATLGVVLPSFLIILAIASVMKHLMRYAPVKAFLAGLRPAVIALILSTAILLALGSFLNVSSFLSPVKIDFRAIIIFVILFLVAFLHKRIRNKALSPLLLIFCSGILGMVLYGAL